MKPGVLLSLDPIWEGKSGSIVFEDIASTLDLFLLRLPSELGCAPGKMPPIIEPPDIFWADAGGSLGGFGVP